MGRLTRPIDDDLVYHALNRGNNRAPVFHDESDHEAFLEALARTRRRYPFRLYGYCLMTNHFHLLLRPESGQPISRIVQSLTVAHTARYHKRHRTIGHVWQGRFKSPVIQDDGHICGRSCGTSRPIPSARAWCRTWRTTAGRATRPMASAVQTRCSARSPSGTTCPLLL